MMNHKPDMRVKYTSLGGVHATNLIPSIWYRESDCRVCRRLVRPRAFDQARWLEWTWWGSVVGYQSTTLSERSWCRLTRLTIYRNYFCDIGVVEIFKLSEAWRERGVNTDISFFLKDVGRSCRRQNLLLGPHGDQEKKTDGWDFLDCFVHALGVFDEKWDK